VAYGVIVGHVGERGRTFDDDPSKEGEWVKSLVAAGRKIWLFDGSPKEERCPQPDRGARKAPTGVQERTRYVVRPMATMCAIKAAAGAQ